MHARAAGERGSGLIISLAVLAMLAIMATSFISLMRLDTRIVRNYVDDQRCEMLAHGMMNYFKALLRDDLDRTWGKYENRDTGVGGYSRWRNTTPQGLQPRIPGRIGYRWGTPVSNDFWLSTPDETWGSAAGGTYTFRGAAYYGLMQQSFAWEDHAWETQGMIGRYYDAPSRREYDTWLGRSCNAWDVNGNTVASNHPNARIPIDDDGDGIANPSYGQSGYENENRGSSGCWNTGWYYDTPPFVIYTGSTYYWSGSPMTGEAALPGNIYWRWGVKVGPTQSMYGNLNVHGNLDGASRTYLDNMGGIGLRARRAVDETTSSLSSEHLGRIEWKGFNGEYQYSRGGFPRRYNNVKYAPSAANLETLFNAHKYSRAPFTKINIGVDRGRARALIRHRWGSDGLPANGTDKWRNGWRRDGATYYKFPSPENPLGDDRYFGANEVIEHDHSVDHPGTSAVAAHLSDDEWRRLRPFLNMWSTDTILRGKIWPAEGPSCGLPPGEWRHIDILKRVNINIIGAKGPDGLGNDALKTRWAAKRRREQDRLYHMLVAALKFTNTANAEQKACQFIASLTDMVDRDDRETYYASPPGTHWALGVEKQAVINEVVFQRKGGSSTLRVELYNPMENIPWIPDDHERFNINNYVIRVGNHAEELKTLTRFGTSDPNQVLGVVGANYRIGADGMYGVPNDTSAGKKTWRRFLHAGWQDPPVTAEVLKNVTIELWKPLSNGAADGSPSTRVPLSANVRAFSFSGGQRRYIRVDHTGELKLVPSGGASETFVGCYRRWDPMNARIYGAQGTNNRSNVVHCPGWSLAHVTLGKPNVGYPRPRNYQYKRRFERNFKIVDGDLPSIGWLGELMMRNCAQDGPFTWVHSQGQNPSVSSNTSRTGYSNRLDTHAKFDLYRPFKPARRYQPTHSQLKGKAVNLHVLDIFTVWDPSNDGIDNDGDGAVDDEDTGYQDGDKAGPEVRVFGRIDLNMMTPNVATMAWPDGLDFINRNRNVGLYYLAHYVRHTYPREWSTANNDAINCHWGPFETLGDLLRADDITCYPGLLLCGTPTASRGWSAIHYRSNQWKAGSNPFPFDEGGVLTGDDDGDGIYNERDERDMVFTWISNHFTTRANVFSIDLNVEICEPPYYPGKKLPYRTYRSNRAYARKQLLGIFDRSMTLRIKTVNGQPGPCDFTGPVGVRMMRLTDDLNVY